MVPASKRLSESAKLAGVCAKAGSLKAFDHGRRGGIAFGHWSARQPGVIFRSVLVPLAAKTAAKSRDLRRQVAAAQARRAEEKRIAAKAAKEATEKPAIETAEQAAPEKPKLEPAKVEAQLPPAKADVTPEKESASLPQAILTEAVQEPEAVASEKRAEEASTAAKPKKKKKKSKQKKTSVEA
jgi:hypothetical protein